METVDIFNCVSYENKHLTEEAEINLELSKDQILGLNSKKTKNNVQYVPKNTELTVFSFSEGIDIFYMVERYIPKVNGDIEYKKLPRIAISDSESTTKTLVLTESILNIIGLVILGIMLIEASPFCIIISKLFSKFIK